MNENLKERKAHFKKYLDEDLNSSPQRWWQQRVNEYTATKDMGSGKKDYPQHAEETIVKYDFKRALQSGALFFVINLLLFYFIGMQHNEKPGGSFWIMQMVILFFITIPFLKRSNRGIIILFKREGFWVNTMAAPVPWEYLAASYIRKDDSGESTNYYLLLYYYDDIQDAFVKVDISIDGMDRSKETIAADLEYWKAKAV